MFRSHGQKPYREIYTLGAASPATYQTLVFYDKLRYRLIPYIYTVAAQTYHNDYTIMRALVMDFPGDNNVHNIGDQYMFGPAILVNAVYEYGARDRDVYLPAGTSWYDFLLAIVSMAERTSKQQLRWRGYRYMYALAQSSPLARRFSTPAKSLTLPLRCMSIPATMGRSICTRTQAPTTGMRRGHLQPFQ